MGLFKNYVSQTRKPEGFLGKMMLKGMNSGHAKMADWGLTHLKKIYPQTIVDLVSFGTCHRVLVFTVTGTQLEVLPGSLSVQVRSPVALPSACNHSIFFGSQITWLF